MCQLHLRVYLVQKKFGCLPLLIIKPDVMSPTLNVNRALFGISCNFFSGITNYNVPNTYYHST